MVFRLHILVVKVQVIVDGEMLLFCSGANTCVIRKAEEGDRGRNRFAKLEEFVRQVIEAYRKTPGTMGAVRRSDRMLAAHRSKTHSCWRRAA